MIEVKSFKGTFNILFVSFFVALLVAALVFFILGNTADETLQFVYDIISISCIAVFMAVGLLFAVPSIISDRHIANNAKKFITMKDYDAAMAFLAGCAKRRRIESSGQLLLYYLGYVELCRDNTEAALHYLKQVQIKKHYGSMVYCAAQTTGYLYMLYKYTGNREFDEIRQIYISKRESFEELLFKNANPKIYKIEKLYSALRYMEYDQPAMAAEELAQTSYIEMPFIKRFCDQYRI